MPIDWFCLLFFRSVFYSLGIPNSLMLPTPSDDSSSIRRACSLSDLSMGRCSVLLIFHITSHFFFVSHSNRYRFKRFRFCVSWLYYHKHQAICIPNMDTFWLLFAFNFNEFFSIPSVFYYLSDSSTTWIVCHIWPFVMSQCDINHF